MKNSVKSGLYSIAQIMDSQNIYNIPRYQRLYVWEKTQVETLMTDIYEAWDKRKPLFYLGGVIIVNTQADAGKYDLIDGQQRFTTLWLISLLLGRELQGFTKARKESRLSFAIREEVTGYFNATLTNRAFSDDIDEKAEGGSLFKIFKAKTLIKSFIDRHFKQDNHNLELFSSFIAEKVKLLVTEVPNTPHLNKLFEVINNRGIQLQHHEILKAKILEKIVRDKSERINYGKIWNACSEMNDYLERNLRNETRVSVADCYEYHNGAYNFSYLLGMMTDRDNSAKPINLKYAMAHYAPKYKVPKTYELNFEEHKDAGEDYLQPVKSILSFPQLLQHTLRIYLHERGQSDIKRINEKELLDSFSGMLKKLDETSAKAFIELLFRVRTVFDNHVIKWVTVAQNDDRHLIKTLNKRIRAKYSKTYILFREKLKSNDSFALLQSMLYHSQQITTHYWLTPLLNHLLYNRNADENLSYLRKLDNILFCTINKDDLALRSWNYLKKKTGNTQYNLDILSEPAGTGFPHYWFYKLEYVLWLTKQEQYPKWKSYYLTAKNSIEHVSPQAGRAEDGHKVTKAFMNKFGNLALVSRSLNSELSNKEYNVKRDSFLNKRDNIGKLESLKLDLMFESPIWNDTLCNTHEQEMKDVLKKYLAQDI